MRSGSYHIFMRGLYVITAIIFLAGNSFAHRFHYVKWDATGFQNGSDWENAFTNLQDALNVALANDTIFVARGIYYPDQGKGITKGDRNASFALKGGVVIMGGYQGNEKFQSFESSIPSEFWKKHWRDWENNKTILSGDLLINDNDNISHDEAARSDNSYHVITTLGPVDTTTEINGLIIEGGNANSSSTFSGSRGGGLYISGSKLRIRNCIFRNNSSLESGGGIYANGGELRIKFSSFINNNSKTGGAITFLGNDNLEAPVVPKVVNSYFFSNKAETKGAGIYAINAANAYVANCVFTQNNLSSGSSSGAGAYYDSKSYPEIVNATFYKNNSGGNGGGLTLYSGRVSNSIFYNNTASGSAQIYLEGMPANSSVARQFISSNIEGGFIGTNITSTDPGFVQPDNPMGEDDYFGTPDDGLQISGNSSLINKGTSWLNIEQSDLLGYPRKSNDSVDIGAYEYQRFNVDYKQVYENLKSGGYILLMRHGITDHTQIDSAGYQADLANCDKQRNLSVEGKLQCDFLWHMMKLLGIPHDTAIASPMCRTKFTARWVFSGFKQTFIWMGVDSQYTDNKLAALGTIPPSGLNSAIVTHQNSIEEVTSFAKGEVQEGDIVIIKPLGGSNFEEVAHFTTDTWEKMIKYVPNNPTAIDENEIAPINFVLYDNYPNPFNPSTTIEYYIPSIEHVSLKIFDALGREVSELVNEVKSPGNYKLSFDASNLASGIYYYRLEAGEFNQTKKLMLLK